MGQFLGVHLNICLQQVDVVLNSFVNVTATIYSQILSAYVWDGAGISLQMVL